MTTATKTGTPGRKKAPISKIGQRFLARVEALFKHRTGSKNGHGAATWFSDTVVGNGFHRNNFYRWLHGASKKIPALALALVDSMEKERALEARVIVLQDEAGQAEERIASLQRHIGAEVEGHG